MSDSFCHLHSHTEFSTLDGLAPLGKVIGRALELKQPALAVTDHGTLSGIYPAWKMAKKLAASYEQSFTLVGGIELYWTPDRHHPPPPAKKEEGAAEGDQSYDRPPRRQHLTALIMDETGYQNMMALIYASSFTAMRGRGGRLFPLVDWELLERHHEGLIVLSGCSSGPLACAIRFGKEAESLAVARRFQKMLGDRFYLEIMPSAFVKQAEINLRTVQIAEEMRIPLVATNDNHWVFQEEHPIHKVLLAIQTKTTMFEPTHREGGRRMCLEEGDYYLRSREEMEQAFQTQHPLIAKSVVLRALEETQAIAERVTYRHPFQEPRLPRFSIPAEEENAFRQWQKENGLRVIGGWQWKGVGSAEEFHSKEGRNDGSER